MKITAIFRGVLMQALFVSAFLAISLVAGLATAASPSDETQASTPSTSVLVADMQQAADKGEGKTPNDKKHPCPEGAPGEPPPGCVNTPVQPGDSSGCTSGNKCTNEGAGCGPMSRFHCATVNSGGVCNCSCM